MPPFGPVSLRRLITALQQAGFAGPYPGGKHQYMVKGELSIRIPNPHGADIGRELLTRLLRQAHISREDWEKL
jgi:predicted RNA binding protein YcfA (HicA-like mRNA interferase family)